MTRCALSWRNKADATGFGQADLATAVNAWFARREQHLTRLCVCPNASAWTLQRLVAGAHAALLPGNIKNVIVYGQRGSQEFFFGVMRHQNIDFALNYKKLPNCIRPGRALSRTTRGSLPYRDCCLSDGFFYAVPDAIAPVLPMRSKPRNITTTPRATSGPASG